MLDLPARRTRRNGSAPSDVNWGRLRRRYRPRVCLFEDRTLLSAPSANPLAAVAIPIALGTPKTGTLAANEVVFFQISPTTDGRLIAQVHSPGGATRLTLMDSQGQVLLTSDGQSYTNQDDQIELYVPAGTDFLEVQNLGGSGTYVLTTSLTPSAPPIQPIPINPDGSGPDAIVAGDFTGDGRTDLAVANYRSNDVSILLGNGDGTFQSPVTYAVGSAPYALVTGDFTGDGRTDLAVANYRSNDVSILLGNGDGTFQSPVTYAVGSAPYALVTGDFTGDGRTDLAVANSGSNDVSILLGKGDGTFQNQVTYAVGSYPTALVTGNFTGDGRTDLAVANSVSNDVSILLGKGDGTFQNQGTDAVGSSPTALVVVGSFDGKPDLVTVNAGSPDLTLISDFMSADSVTSTIWSGGTEPDAAFSFSSGSGFDDLVVGNSGDGVLALFEGSEQGLTLTSKTNSDLVGLTALTFSALTGGQIQFYAATAGREVPTLVDLSLGRETQPPPSTNNLAQLVPLQQSSLAVVGTLLVTMIESPGAEVNLSPAETETTTALAFSLATPVSVGQGTPGQGGNDNAGGGGDEEAGTPADAAANRAGPDASSWQTFLSARQLVRRFRDQAALRTGSGNLCSGRTPSRRQASSSPFHRAASSAAKASTPCGDQLIPWCLQRADTAQSLYFSTRVLAIHNPARCRCW